MIRTTNSTSGYRGGRRGLSGDNGRYITRNQLYRQVRQGLGLSAG